VSPTDASWAWTLQSPPVPHGFHHTGYEMWTGFLINPVKLSLSFMWYVIPRGPWTVVGTFGLALFISDFSRGHIASGVTSQFPTFASYRFSAFLRIINLTVLVIQLTAILHAGSWVTCHSFLHLSFCYSRLSIPGRSLFRSESVSLLVDSHGSLYQLQWVLGALCPRVKWPQHEAALITN
jgi:hypothetical protein